VTALVDEDLLPVRVNQGGCQLGWFGQLLAPGGWPAWLAGVWWSGLEDCRVAADPAGDFLSIRNPEY